jgi:hypothetical protein
MTWEELRKAISRSYSLDELRTLSSDLDLDFEEFGGRGKSAKVQELLICMRQDQRVVELIDKLKRERPHISWAIPSEATRTAFTQRRGEYKISYLQRVEEYWITRKLEVEAPSPHWIEVKKRINGRVQSGELKDILDRDMAAVVIGDVGSGKTVALCTLIRELTISARLDPSGRLPIALDASSWRLPNATGNKEDFRSWLISHFCEEYQAGTRLAEKWLSDPEKFILIFDGVGEIGSDYRTCFVQAINDYCAEYGWFNVILTCRTDIFRSLTPRLEAPTVIELLPLDAGLTPEAYQQRIITYLGTLQSVDARLSNLCNLLEKRPTLLSLINTPLLLRLLIDVYQQAPETIVKVAKLGDEEHARGLLLDAYVDIQFEGANKRSRGATHYERGQCERWLSWLAQQLRQNSFYIEHMQPDWLPTEQWLPYRIYASLVATLVYGLPVGLVFGMALASVRPIPYHQSMMAGLAFGLILGVGAAVSYFLLADGWVAALGVGFSALAATWAFLGIAAYSQFTIIVFSAAAGFFGTVVPKISGAIEDKQTIRIERFGFSWKQATIRALSVLGISAITGGLAEIALGQGWFNTLLLFGLLAGILTLGYSFRTQVEWERIAEPSHELRQARKNALVSSLIFFFITVVGTLTYGALFGASTPTGCGEYIHSRAHFGVYLIHCLYLPLGVEIPVALGVAMGMMIYIGFGGLASIKHHVLYFLLKKSNYVPPGDYVAFLDYATTELNVLHCIGARYEFIWDLQHYFATRYPDKNTGVILRSEAA